MKRYVFTVLLVLFALSSFADYLDNRAYYPIVTKANGSGGTKWLTEVSMTNPQNHEIRISIQLAQNGTTKNWYYDLGPGKTATWSDFLGIALNRSGNATFVIGHDRGRPGNGSAFNGPHRGSGNGKRKPDFIPCRRTSGHRVLRDR